ncbi:LamG-like jellyroll fold domain-containing protein [Bizionia sp. KMM 8389]
MKNTLPVYLCALALLFSVSQLSAQSVVIAKNEFLGTGSSLSTGGTGTLSSILAEDDNWGFQGYIDNGRIDYSDEKSSSTDYSLRITDWYDKTDYVEFSEINISDYSNVQFSIAYASNSLMKPDDRLNLTYYMDNVATIITLIHGRNGGAEVNFGSSADNGTSQSNPYVLDIPNSVSQFKFKVELISGGGDDKEIIYIDDVYLRGIAPAPPTADCQDIITIALDAFGSATITANDVDGGSTVSSGMANLSVNHSEFNCDDLGDNTVMLTVTDIFGQTDTCCATVTVTPYSGGLVAPVLDDVTMYCEYTVPVPTNSGYQCEDIMPTTSDITTFTTAGTYSVTWVYTATDGSTASASQEVTILAQESPTNISVSDAEFPTLLVTWDELMGVDNYGFRYREVGDVAWEEVVISTNSFSLLDMSQLTDYEFQVSSICGGSQMWSSTQTFSTGLYDVYCVPTSNSNGSYITNFSITGENSTMIDNGPSNGDDGGYGDYRTLPAVELYQGASYTASIAVHGGSMGWGVYIDLNKDGVFYRSGDDDPNDEFFDLPSEVGEGLSDIVIDIPATASLGKTVMRVGARQYWSSVDPCGDSADNNEEFEDYLVDIVINNSPAKLTVSGGGTAIPGDGTNTPLITDFTDFGSINVGERTTREFTLSNSGYHNLEITDISLSNTADFELIGVTLPITIPPGMSELLTIAFNANLADLDRKTSTVTIVSNSEDNDVAPYYWYNISASKDQKFYDSDGDGVFDNVDIDDDNDGIPDDYEEQSCNLSPAATKTNYKFLNETFGVGPGRGNDISTLYDATTTYCLENGTNSANTAECPDLNSPNLNDGEYTINHRITSANNDEAVGPNEDDAIADWADRLWAPIEDHTPGDTNGRMAIFNADIEPGVFYETTITGTIPNVPITYSFWAINIDNKDSAFDSSELVDGRRIKPNIRVDFLKTDYSTVIGSFTTGEITRCESGNDCDVSVWKYFEPEEITTSETTFIVRFVNESPGGFGNDLALDDIKIEQTLCDMDGDGVADMFDLDSDNDGIPDIVEAGFASSSNGTGKIDVDWVDVNKNGMLDSLEGIGVLDTDGDGIPDYLDLDSDNDGLFDVDESGAQNSNNPYPNFINGDGDINGDGVGDGPESEKFRIKDTDGDGNIEYYGDGILDVYDYHYNYTAGANAADTYGNDSQGTAYAATGYTLDSDNDGVPDYLDVYNNLTSVYDIDTTIYTGLDLDNDGIIDDGQSGSYADNDGDGVPDSRDGNDDLFGAPRDLDDSYSLYFDGRNDYVEDETVLSGTDATIMAFVKKDGDNTLVDFQQIIGQENANFELRINLLNEVVASVGSNVIKSDPVLDGVWIHITATTTSGKTILYINGVQVGDMDSGVVPANTSKLTIGARNGGSNFFKGEIDEVRVFDRALTANEVKRMVHQELDENESFNKGKIIPKTIGDLHSSLIRYYKMDGYLDDILDNKKTEPTNRDTIGAKLYNIKDIYFQTAPLPYVTKSDGEWTDASTWLHGDIWDISTKVSGVDDASIVHVKNHLNASDSQRMIGLIVDDSKEFTISDDQGLYNDWYLKLDGFIDLVGESQLIQSSESDLFNGPNAKLERDQQGTVNLYTYNYWSSPVHSSASASPVDGSEDFSVADVLRDGTDPDNPEPISYVGGYDGAASPMEIADYWLWKFDNYRNDTYADWQSISSSSRLNVGVGYTMKGTTTAPETDYQNYVFTGKPNNGTVSLSLSPNNEYLVGNPYPSAIDGYKFIKDNESVITGTLYFWEHYGGNSHILAEYQGGYGLYNLSGGVPAIDDILVQQASPDDDVSNLGVPTKTPRQYIPVSQGFFVMAQDGGEITFDNSQRVFVKEGDSNTNSWFFRSEDEIESDNNPGLNLDVRPKFRIGYTSPKGYKRQLLLTVDDQATPAVDWGFDGLLNEENVADMYWVIDDANYLIQGIDAIAENTILPITVKASEAGNIEVSIDSLENVSDATNILLKDGDNYHDLRTSNYIATVGIGETIGRFDIVFSDLENLSVTDFETSEFAMYPNPAKDQVTIKLPQAMLMDNLVVGIYDMQGRLIAKQNITTSETKIELSKMQVLSSGMYLVKITENNTVLMTEKLIKI